MLEFIFRKHFFFVRNFRDCIKRKLFFPYQRERERDAREKSHFGRRVRVTPKNVLKNIAVVRQNQGSVRGWQNTHTPKGTRSDV